jgi:ferric iron reductase protein FhuF
LFQGPLAELADALSLAPIPPADSIAVGRLTDGSSVLDATLRRYAARLGYDSDDLRPVASAWAMAYTGALLPPVCAAATMLRHVFPVAAGQTAVTLARDGTPISFHITSEGAAMPCAGASARYTPLIWHHLLPLFEALSAHTRLPTKILWANTSRQLLAIFETAGQLAPGMPDLRADREHLLHSPTWDEAAEGRPARPNPLHGRDRSVVLRRDGQAETLRLHRQCCLYYLLPATGYCDACPLDPRLRGTEACGRASQEA